VFTKKAGTGGKKGNPDVLVNGEGEKSQPLPRPINLWGGMVVVTKGKEWGEKNGDAEKGNLSW